MGRRCAVPTRDRHPAGTRADRRQSGRQPREWRSNLSADARSHPRCKAQHQPRIVHLLVGRDRTRIRRRAEGALARRRRGARADRLGRSQRIEDELLEQMREAASRSSSTIPCTGITWTRQQSTPASCSWSTAMSGSPRRRYRRSVVWRCQQQRVLARFALSVEGRWSLRCRPPSSTTGSRPPAGAAGRGLFPAAHAGRRCRCAGLHQFPHRGRRQHAADVPAVDRGGRAQHRSFGRYFVPDSLTPGAGQRARTRGESPDHRAGRAYRRRRGASRLARQLGELLAAGAQIHEFEPTMFHCKMMIIDGLLVSVGSTNFDNRSFRLHDEANLNLYDRTFAATGYRSLRSRPRAVAARDARAVAKRPWHERCWNAPPPCSHRSCEIGSTSRHVL